MTERLSPPQRAILRAFCGFATHLCYLFLCPVASGGLLSRRGESRQRHARGNLFRGGSLWTPSPTTKGAPPPLDSPLLDERRGTGVYEGRETKDEGRGTRDGGQETHRGLSVSLTGRPRCIGITLPYFPVYRIAARRSGCDLGRTFRRNHRAFALARIRSIPANKDIVSPASSPRPVPGPKARRACCRRGDGGSPARSPAWRR